MENRNLKIFGIIGFLLIVAFFAFGNNKDGKVAHNSGVHMMSDGTYMLNDDMHNMHEYMNVATDEEFIKVMIPHHQEAVDTAREVLARGGSFDEIKVLAENIIASQNIEIDQMKTWHREWFGAEYSPDDSYKPMMRDLTKLSGKDLDKVFLEDMVMHHMGAVMMAQQALGFSERGEIKNLSNEIIKAQNTEIAQMQEWLKTKF